MIRSFLSPGLRSLASRPASQLPALDALRSLAILLVIAAHTTQAFENGGGVPNALSRFRGFTGGWVGVDLFFALSGFLIGRQLWQELARTGTVRVGSFLVRRGLRIWPLYYAVLLLTVAGTALAGRELPPVWPEALFLSNYLPVRYVGGSWSLATEEQFYLFVPLLGLLLSRVARKPGAVVAVLALLFAALPAVRLLTWARFGSGDHHDVALVMRYLYEPIHTHADGLLFGMLLAYLHGLGDTAPRRHPWVFFSGALLLGIAARKAELLAFEYTFLALLFGGLTWVSLGLRPGNPLTRALCWPGFYVISRLSFGMYLMHQCAMEPLLRAALAAGAGAAASLQFALFAATNLTATLLLAALGFLLVEHPFLRLRARLGFEPAH